MKRGNGAESERGVGDVEPSGEDGQQRLRSPSGLSHRRWMMEKVVLQKVNRDPEKCCCSLVDENTTADGHE
ncbi:hypothetical protein HPP92_018432 [Vanilla planifolia]|uniref:Uncharacterized protein n=1 Tax=Vanilla planifolia TaxID=51239 RepID=A0A835UM91_VANPL|nr:hypothetical protein HPP92_018432 [Vanilla planifolia]